MFRHLFLPSNGDETHGVESGEGEVEGHVLPKVVPNFLDRRAEDKAGLPGGVQFPDALVIVEGECVDEAGLAVSRQDRSTGHHLPLGVSYKQEQNKQQ